MLKKIIALFRGWYSPRKTQALVRDVLQLKGLIEQAIQEQERIIRRRDQLEAQIVQLRVSQSRIGRAGWEVMCFIPEEILSGLRKVDNRWEKGVGQVTLVEAITRRLVDYAIKGIHRVDSQGKVSALVFAPLDMNKPPAAPEFVQALFDKDGKYKLSEKCWDQRSHEERVKSAAGCGGYGGFGV